MKLFYALLFNFIFLSAYSQQYETAIAKARFLVKNHMEMTQVPGAQVAVMVDGKLVWSEAFGWCAIDDSVATEINTRFRVASVSKSMTSVALGKLVDEGAIDLDDNILQYVPEFPSKEAVITSRHLAASVSGIRHYNSSDPENSMVQYDHPFEATERFRDDPLEFLPGTAYGYSSYGWVLLSAAMESAAGQSFDELMNTTWEDLGMQHTSFDYSDQEVPNKSRFYSGLNDGKRVLAPAENRSFMFAGGGYLSTAEDLTRMGTTLMEGSYLTRQTWQELTTPYILSDGEPTYYALGWETGTSRLGTPIIYHGGSMPSARSHLMLYPEHHLAMAILYNTGQSVFFNEREAHVLAECFIDSTREEQSNPFIGQWNIETTSLRNRRSKGQLQLTNENGLISGKITFRRSRKKKTFPVCVVEASADSVHLVAVTPMFADFYIHRKELKGRWLHDMDVKRIGEVDDYWGERALQLTEQ